MTNIHQTTSHGPGRKHRWRAVATLIATVIALGVESVGARGQIYPQSSFPFPGVNWPPSPSQTRLDAEANIAAEEKEVAALINAQAPDFLDAGPDEKTDMAIVNANLIYQRIIQPRFDNASLGCHEAQMALMAWFLYWPTLQKMGIAEDREVQPVIDGKPRTNSFDLPDRIFDTLVRVCVAEAHDRCVATGDFPSIFDGLVELQRTWEDFLGREVKPEWVDAYVNAAKLCGQWKLSIATEFEKKGRPNSCCGINGKMHRDIPLHWEPNGSGIGNIFNSTIEGESDVEVDMLDFNGDLCQRKHTPPVQTEKAKAKLTGLVFEASNAGPATSKGPVAPSGYLTPIERITPRHVWLEFHFGEVETKLTTKCPYHMDDKDWRWIADASEVTALLLQNKDAFVTDEPEIYDVLVADNPEHSSKPETPSRWRFASTPFRAYFDAHETASNIAESDDVHLTLRLTHTPQ